MVEIFQRIIEERRKNPERNYNDMLDYFLSQKIEGLSDEVIHDNLTIMFFAGEDTTAKTLTALISILKQFPHIHEEVLVTIFDMISYYLLSFLNFCISR